MFFEFREACAFWATVEFLKNVPRKVFLFVFLKVSASNKLQCIQHFFLGLSLGVISTGPHITLGGRKTRST